MKIVAAAGAVQLHVELGLGQRIVRDRAEPVGEAVGAGEHAEHARHRLGARGVDPTDAGVRVRRAHHRGIGLARRTLKSSLEAAPPGPAPLLHNNGTEFPLVWAYIPAASMRCSRSRPTRRTSPRRCSTAEQADRAQDRSGGAPCQEVVITDDIDVRRFPIPTYSPDDGGPYVTPASSCQPTPKPVCRTSATTAF